MTVIVLLSARTHKESFEALFTGAGAAGPSGVT